MKKLLVLLFILNWAQLQAQWFSGKVKDKILNRPIPYAMVLYDAHTKIIYTDSLGNFSLPKDSLQNSDTLFIENIGYTTLAVPVATLTDNSTFYLEMEDNLLKPVFITSCKREKSFVINKRVGPIKQYVGPGPEYKLIILAKYENSAGKPGYIESFSVYLDEPDKIYALPLRLRWYEWDVMQQAPGKELTDTNLFVYPYKKGWNTFEIPPYTIFFPAQQLVLGVEFIYSPAYNAAFAALKTNKEKIAWYEDMRNRWVLGMQYVREKSDGAYYIVNNTAIQAYGQKVDRFYIRPAIKFSLAVCVEK